MNKPRSRRTAFPIAAWASLALATTALAQNGLPYTIESPPEARHFGSRVASGGDANNDGYDDIFVVDDGAEENGQTFGRWYMYSGIDGTLIWSGIGLESSGTETHFTAEFLADLDGDGCDDVILGRSRLLDSRGGVDVFSGRTGDLLYSYRGAEMEDRMGWAISGLGDLNDDDVPDFGFNTRYTLAGEVSIRSGRDGSEIRRFDVDWPRQIRDAGDINQDLVADIALSSFHQSQRFDAVRVISGADGQLIWEVARDSLGGDHDFGYQLAAGTDVTGDHIPDVLASGELAYDGTAYLLSGADGAQLTTYKNPANPYRHHIQLLGVNLEFADLTGDGSAEVVAGGFEQILICEPLTGRVLSRRSKLEGRNTFSGTELAVGDVNGDGLSDIIVGLTAYENNVGGSVAVSSGGRMLLRLIEINELPRDVVLRGYDYDVEVYSGSPNRTVRLLGSRSGHDCTFVPQLGICIDLTRRIYDLGHAITDSDGFAVFHIRVPRHAPLIPIWIQALDIDDPTRGPITSNVLELEITAP